MDKLKMEVPYFQSPNRIFEIDGLTEHEIIVYLYLCRCANQGSKAFPSYPDIAYKASISEATAKRAIKGLVEKELIIKHNTFKKSDNGKISRASNVYEVYANIDEYLKTHKSKKTKSSIIKEIDGNTSGHTDPRGSITQTPPSGHTDPIKRTIYKELSNKELYINTEKKNTDKNIEENFEKLWNLYPLKRGKGSISKTKKNEIFKIGFERMTVAIERYIKDTELRREDFAEINYKNGSTFFNTGYIDYLQEDFTYYKPKSNKKPLATNYEQRDNVEQLNHLTNMQMEEF